MVSATELVADAMRIGNYGGRENPTLVPNTTKWAELARIHGSDTASILEDWANFIDDEYLKTGMVELNHSFKQGGSFLFRAVYRHSLPEVKLFLNYKLDPNAGGTHQGTTCLIRAVSRGMGSIVPKLLLAGANPNTVNNVQQSPGWWATYKLKMPIIRELANAGANLNIPDANGHTGFWVYSRYGCKDLNTSNLRELIKLGIDINWVGDRGRTALQNMEHYAKTSPKHMDMLNTLRGEGLL